MLLVSVMQLQLASATGALLSGSNSNTDTDNTDDSSLSLGNDFDTDWYYLKNVNKDEERESRDLFNPNDEKPFLKRLQRYYWIKRSSNRVVKKIKPLELNGYSIDINIKQFRSPVGFIYISHYILLSFVSQIHYYKGLKQIIGIISLIKCVG
jgi:hypothetical protein